MGNVAGKWAFSAYLVYYIYNSPSFNPASVSLTLIQCFHFPHIFAIPPWSSRFCILHLIYTMFFFNFFFTMNTGLQVPEDLFQKIPVLHSQLRIVSNFSIPLYILLKFPFISNNATVLQRSEIQSISCMNHIAQWMDSKCLLA